MGRKELVDGILVDQNKGFIEALPGETADDALRRAERESILTGEVKALRAENEGLRRSNQMLMDTVAQGMHDTKLIADQIREAIVNELRSMVLSVFQEDDEY